VRIGSGMDNSPTSLYANGLGCSTGASPAHYLSEIS
jgi:hypothetical protein